MKLESLPSKSPALRLIEFVNALGSAPLPQPLTAQAKWCLLDALGCGLFGSRVQLHLDNGEVKEAATLNPHGTAADPCTSTERIAKFVRLAGLSPLKRDPAAIVAAVQSLDTAKSARELGKLLRD